MSNKCGTHHTICERSPLLEVSSQAFVCRFKAQAPNEELSELLRLAWDLECKAGVGTQKHIISTLKTFVPQNYTRKTVHNGHIS